MRKQFIAFLAAAIAFYVLATLFFPAALWSAVLVGPVLALGTLDLMQTRHTIRRNFPFLGRFRYWFEAIRPEINQYFVESNTDGVPFSREQRSLVYQRSKRELDTLPFGTQKNVYEVGYEWVNHSFMPKHLDHAEREGLRVVVGGPDCLFPYRASLLNISAMSYGALSKQAVLALNGGAKDGGFAHNTGEGGLSPYHLEPGGDLIWQIGTGYFSCRGPDGRFDENKFAERAVLPQVKMIEIKISQGAKPGHGGILPAQKVTKEISEIRGVVMGQDVLSPPGHSAFSTPIEFMQFIGRVRQLSGGKPVGFKFCLGKRREFLAVLKAMEKTGIAPDYIAIDGGEGGTGAAPLEFSNHVGSPGADALIFVHNALVGFGLRDRVRIMASGRVTSGFELIKRLALGADMIYAARAFMMALGCIQALRCNSNQCPTGVATQDPELSSGLVVRDKRVRVRNFHDETLKSVSEIIGAMGLDHASDLRPWHIMRRVSQTETMHYGQMYEYLKPGALLGTEIPSAYRMAMAAACAESFHHVDEYQRIQALDLRANSRA